MRISPSSSDCPSLTTHHSPKQTMCTVAPPCSPEKLWQGAGGAMRDGSSACNPRDLTMGIASASMAAGDEQGQGAGAAGGRAVGVGVGRQAVAAALRCRCRNAGRVAR